MICIAPGYISPAYMPYAADIFFHDQLLYFIPTGFTPLETHAVLDFPTYCYNKRIALPEIYWKFCSRYFVNSKLALNAMDILEPLRVTKNIIVSALSYPRNIAAIGRAIQILDEKPILKQLILNAPLDVNFVSREICSHLLFEVLLEKKDFDGILQYIQGYLSNEQILKLVTAVLINRLQVFTQTQTKILLFDDYYLDILAKFETPHGGETEDVEEYHVDAFTSRLFSSILYPIYGRCNTRRKSAIIAELNREKRDEINHLIKECRAISTDMFLLPPGKAHLKRARLSQLIETRILEPLSDLIDQPKRNTKKFLIEATTSSGIIAALMSMVLQPIPSFGTVGVSIAAGITSTALRQFIEKRLKKKNPSRFLITSLKKMKVESDALLEAIRRIPEFAISDLQKAEEK